MEICTAVPKLSAITNDAEVQPILKVNSPTSSGEFSNSDKSVSIETETVSSAESNDADQQHSNNNNPEDSTEVQNEENNNDTDLTPNDKNRSNKAESLVIVKDNIAKPLLSKTILSDKISTTNESVLKTSEKDCSDFEEDPTMPGIEAVHCPKVIMNDLAEPKFDMWKLNRDSMVDHIEYMFHDLGIVRAWKIPRTTLKMFLLAVRERYQDNPYHNFQHCFCVTQMAYSMLCKLRLRNVLSVDHMGALLTAAVCHDVDHPGLNNSYHCHARTPLAILYNYQSILEQHHFAVTCRILSNKERNIFRNVSNRDEILTNVGELILATDLTRHKTITEEYSKSIAAGFDFNNSGHVVSLLKVIIKCADVSNEVRPETVAGPWVERLFAEYYEQSAREKREHLPVTPYMDPDLVNVSESQENFIRGMMIPLFRQLSRLMVDAKRYYVTPLYETLTRYEIQNERSRH